MRALEQRIVKLEAVTTFPSALRATVLHRPGEQSTTVERADYVECLDAATRAGGPLILLTLQRSLCPTP